MNQNGTPNVTESNPATAAEHGLRPDEAAEAPRKARRGFAAMDPARVSEIARKGGMAAHARGTAHQFTSEEAQVAGRKGGRATHAKRRSLSPGGPMPEG
ncbi:MAG: KGG domain-containing protein [Polyangiaceae bacterium]